MPSLVEGDDRQTVKRTVPKSSNKIQAVGIVRLYVAPRSSQKWTYTGLQGAAVLANDLVGNTYWLKLVDLSPSNRGVIWDQEIYDTFQYNQDRTFFHSFELEDCMAAFSFADEKEAKKFKQKVDEREKNAHRNTRSKPFGQGAGSAGDVSANGGKSHGMLGGLFGRDKSSAPQQPPTSIIPPRETGVASGGSANGHANPLQGLDPKLLKELLDMGLTEQQLSENVDFIQNYVKQNKATSRIEQQSVPQPLTPDDTGSSASKRGPPPAPPAPRRPAGAAASPTPDNDAPTPPRRNFAVPPPIADAGKYADDLKSHSGPPIPPRAPEPQQSAPGPPPPARPPKEPVTDSSYAPKFGVPPPFQGDRLPPPPPPMGSKTGAVPPPLPPSRGSVPPTPPPRESASPPKITSASPAASLPPPPLPPKTPNAPPPLPATSGKTRDVPPPPPPPTTSNNAPVPPPLPPTANKTPVPPPLPPTNNVPPPPLPPTNNVPPPPPPPPLPVSNNGPPPPPPPPPSGGAPPPPPLPPGMEAATANAPELPKSGGGRDNLMSDIRGGAQLRKVADSEKNDRSSATVGGSSSGSAAPTPSSGEQQGGLAGALASALAARKSKVSQNDDNDDDDDKDDW